MVRLAVILKEVLAGTNEVPAFNLQVKLFDKLAEECLASRFPALTRPPGSAQKLSPESRCSSMWPSCKTRAAAR